MKTAALRFLVCPSCKKELALDVEAEDGPEIMKGTLSCRVCGAAYPILDGVPRFLGSGSYASSFGYQWNRFREVQLDSRSGTTESEETLYATTGWAAEDYCGRLVLDAGVGAGRFAEVAARKGAEVVGVDLTVAVDAAYANLGRHEKVTLVQADIFAMPFREATFDLAYSIGVLHHTPDPRAAFGRVVAAVKPGGALAVYLYHSHGVGHRCSDVIRKMTTRLPVKTMLVISAAAIPLHYLYQVPVLGKALRLFCPISPHRDWRWRWLDTFDWYTPKYQWKFRYPEVFRWFRANGFGEIDLFDDPIRMRGVKAREAAGRAGGRLRGARKRGGRVRAGELIRSA